MIKFSLSLITLLLFSATASCYQQDDEDYENGSGSGSGSGSGWSEASDTGSEETFYRTNGYGDGSFYFTKIPLPYLTEAEYDYGSYEIDYEEEDKLDTLISDVKEVKEDVKEVLKIVEPGRNVHLKSGKHAIFDIKDDSIDVQRKDDNNQSLDKNNAIYINIL
ncbi:hypothetical protein C0J52_08183 [Blattella germanica]|nr:hypothetical protein C0J52_08183 [Blattella germanica]